MDVRSKSDLQDIRKASELQPYILKNIERTDRRLGSGSFGYVVEVIHAGARCAGKVLHDGLIDSRGTGHKNMIRKIEFECRVMSSLRHPNIVQFLGICFFEERSIPVLVMECLDANLETLLTQTSNLSIHAKINVLLDVAKGLVYLHSHSPPIIHRDLTARNILLTNTLSAKIADLGNSRIIESNALTKTLSTVPGTLVYMPPEAMANPPQYNEKLDIFSFGHLALYTALQDFPCELLLGVYNDPKDPNKALARNEVERRFQYVSKLRTKFGPNHMFTKLVTDCLHNHPQIRPSAIEVLQQLQKLQKDHGSGGMRFSLSDYVHNMPEEKVHYGHQPAVQRSLERLQSGGMDMLEKEVRHRIGKNTWNKYAFQISDSALQYFSRVDRRPDGEVQLNKIRDVVYVDDDPSDPYQFNVIIDGRRPWKLKASSEEARHCWIAALKPRKGYPHMYGENQRYAVNRRDTEESLDLDAYAYVQMAPSAPPENTRQMNLSRQYQQLGDQNLPQLYDDPSEAIHEQHGQEQIQKVYDFSKNQEPDRQPLKNLHDVPNIRSAAAHFEEKQHPKAAEGNLPNVQLRPQDHHRERPPSFNVQDLDQEQIQILISQLERMGVLSRPKHPFPTAEVEELYPELHADDTYDTISDGEERVYDDISEPKHLYVNVPEVRESSQAKKKVGPPPPPKIQKEVYKHDAVAIPRTKSVGCLLRETSDLSERLLDQDDEGSDSGSEQNALHSSWMKANTTSSTVREDDPLLLAGEQALYISKDSLTNLKKIGEGQFGVVYKATLRNSDGRLVEVAIKTIRRYDSQKEMDDFMREMAVMSQLIHPNIIHLYGLVKEEDWIVLEYLPNGDLKTFLTMHHRPTKSLMRYMADIAMGMLYLSERGLIHRDLAARNVMVGKNESCKVADFGLLRELEDYKEVYISSNISLCPLRWMAPESLEHKQFSTSSDVWSYGILLWEMFNPTEIPYPELTDFQVTAKLARGYSMSTPPQCPSIVARIMRSCWRSDPSRRPSFAFISVLLTRANLEGAI